MSGLVVLGQVVGAHALRGQVRVRYFGDGPDSLLSLSTVRLAESRDAARSDFYAVTFSGLGRKGEARLGLQGITDRGAAEELRGLLVLAEEGQLEPPEEGEYYWHQLIGMEVWTDTGKPVGTLEKILDTGGHDVYVVRKGERETLVPAVRDVIQKVDVAGKRMVIHAIEGLLNEDDL